MLRLDQEKFEQFVKPLVRFDPIWERYINQGEYMLERNPLRQPGRILRRGDRLPELLDEAWRWLNKQRPITSCGTGSKFRIYAVSMPNT